MWAKLHLRGAPGHGSMPYGTDNALVKAAEVVRRVNDYRPPTRLDDAWMAFVGGLGIPEELAGPLLQEDGFVDSLALLPSGTGVAVRNSRDPNGPALVYTRGEIAAFLGGVLDGEFDDLLI